MEAEDDLMRVMVTEYLSVWVDAPSMTNIGKMMVTMSSDHLRAMFT